MAFDTHNVDTALSGTTIACPSIDSGLLDRYLAYFIRTGHLPPPVPPVAAVVAAPPEHA